MPKVWACLVRMGRGGKNNPCGFSVEIQLRNLVASTSTSSTFFSFSSPFWITELHPLMICSCLAIEKYLYQTAAHSGVGLKSRESSLPTGRHVPHEIRNQITGTSSFHLRCFGTLCLCTSTPSACSCSHRSLCFSRLPMTSLWFCNSNCTCQ